MGVAELAELELVDCAELLVELALVDDPEAESDELLEL